MLRQPIVQLNPGTMGHAQVGDHHLIPLRSGLPELPQRYAAILRLVRVPPSAAKIAGQSRSNRRFIVDDQHAPL